VRKVRKERKGTSIQLIDYCIFKAAYKRKNSMLQLTGTLITCFSRRRGK
jgi:hypothetical protein